jgi:DNA-binding NarL/FixJ family response regulator
MVQSLSAKTFGHNASPTRTLLVTMREGSLHHLMSPQAPLEGYQRVGEATTCQEALGLCGRVKPDLLLLDLRPPRADSDLAFLSTIHQRWPQVRMVAVAGRADQPELQDLHDAGGIRVLVETEATRTLAELLEPLCANPRHPLADSSLRACTSRHLSAREQQALGLALAGRDSQEIASQLGVNPLTATLHVQNALGKIRAGATQAGAQAKQDSELSTRPVSRRQLEAMAGTGRMLLPPPSTRLDHLLGFPTSSTGQTVEVQPASPPRTTI